MSENNKLHWFAWLQANQSIFAAVALPIFLALVGWLFTAAQTQAANKLKYVEIAISVLQSKPTESQAGLREWAIEVLDKDATVPLTEKAKVALRSESAPFSNHLAASAVATTAGSAALSVVTRMEQKPQPSISVEK
jgi:hypothetical protein